MRVNCVRCWINIQDWLWCKKCRARVDEEFRWEVSRPYEYYFRHHLKRQRALDKKTKQLFWELWDFGSWKTLNRLLIENGIDGKDLYSNNENGKD